MSDNGDVTSWKRDRTGRGRTGRRRVRGGAWFGSIAPEVIGEVIFAGVVLAVSFLLFGEVNGYFVGGVFLGVNGVLLLLAAAAWAMRRRRAPGRGRRR